MDRAQKSQAVAVLREDFSQAGLVVVVHNHGLTVAEVTELRQKVKKAGATFKVAKNRLAKIAANDTKFDKVKEFLKGPSALAISKDPVAAAKVVVEYSKDNEKLSIQGGVLDGQVMTAEEVKTLASLPSLDELRAKVIGIISEPARRIAGVLQAPPAQLARVLKAHAEKGEA